MVELVRARGAPSELAKQFELTDVTIRNWLKQADRDEGRREEGLTSAELEILAHRPDAPSGKATAWFARKTESIPDESSSS